MAVQAVAETIAAHVANDHVIGMNLAKSDLPVSLNRKLQHRLKSLDRVGPLAAKIGHDGPIPNVLRGPNGLPRSVLLLNHVQPRNRDLLQNRPEIVRLDVIVVNARNVVNGTNADLLAPLNVLLMNSPQESMKLQHHVQSSRNEPDRHVGLQNLFERQSKPMNLPAICS
jgi:hypothetical protein